MFKLKPALFVFLICATYFLISVISVFAEDSITITTYYPSPYGVYKQLRLYRTDDIDPDEATINTCTTDNEGEMYYDDSANKIYVCDGERWRGQTVEVRTNNPPLPADGQIWLCTGTGC